MLPIKEWYDEESVGRALRTYARTNSVADIVVVTKVHPRSFREDKLRESIAQSQRNLHHSLNGTNLDSLDVVLLHSPYCWRGHCTKEEESFRWQDAWRTLEALKREGKIAHIGVSNFDSQLLRELLDISNTKVSVIQNWMDPFNQDRDVRELARRFGIHYMSYSSFGTQWEWKLHRNPVFTSETLENIAKQHNCTIAQVVLAWLRQRNCISIPRSSSKEHLHDNFSKGDLALTSEELEIIDQLDNSLGSLWN